MDAKLFFFQILNLGLPAYFGGIKGNAVTSLNVELDQKKVHMEV